MSGPRKSVVPSPYPGDKDAVAIAWHAASVGATTVMFDLAAASARLLIYVRAGGILSPGEVEKIRDATRLLGEAIRAAIEDGGPNTILPANRRGE